MLPTIFWQILITKTSRSLLFWTYLPPSTRFPMHIFVERLVLEYGIKSAVLSWFSSYFKDRFQSFQVNGSTSKPSKFTTGKSQGSGASLWGYTTYTGSLCLLICVLLLSCCMFYDDTQIHTFLRPASKQFQLKSKSKLEGGLEQIAGRMTETCLMLNSDTTELILVGARQKLSKIDFNSINVFEDPMTTELWIRKLVV